MNNDLLFDGKTYISVSRASKKLGYTADYIGQLCRAGKVDARMIGRTWYVEWESVKNHKKSKKHRIRRTAEEIRKAKEDGTAKFVSVTSEVAAEGEKDKDCPPEEYLEKIDKQNEENPIAPIHHAEPIYSFANDYKKEEVIVKKAVDDCPPEEYLKKIDEALPINYSTEEWLPTLSKKTQAPIQTEKVLSVYHPSAMLVGALSLFVFFNLLFIGMNIVQPSSTAKLVDAISGIANPFNDSGEDKFALNKEAYSKNIENTSSVLGGIKDVFSFMFGGIKEKINAYAISYVKSLGFATNAPAPERPLTPIKSGMAVVPDVKDHDATVASIKKTFSDEVSVIEDEDSQSGVIVPHFREADGEAYTYVLIPINSP